MTWTLIDLHAGFDAGDEWTQDQREWIPRYALYDSVRTRFVSDRNGDQLWDAADEFDGADDAETERGRSLFPRVVPDA